MLRIMSVSCLVIDCQSLKNKVADIAAVINENKPDIILGNGESWLNLTTARSKIFPDGYTILGKDRLDGHNGSVFFKQYYKKEILLLPIVLTWTGILRLSGVNAKLLGGVLNRTPNALDVKRS